MLSREDLALAAAAQEKLTTAQRLVFEAQMMTVAIEKFTATRHECERIRIDLFNLNQQVHEYIMKEVRGS